MKQIEKPMLFSAPMVLALDAGTKTMTRRLFKKPVRDPNFGCELAACEIGDQAGELAPHPVGSLIWVKETWKCHCVADHEGVLTEPHHIGTCIKYKADGAMIKPDRWNEEEGFWCEAHDAETKWRPSIFMPRWASRISLRVTGCRVERLQSITEADAVAEGMQFHDGGDIGHSGWRHDRSHGFVYPTAVAAFQWLWETVHGAGAWDANPFVFAYTFEKV